LINNFKEKVPAFSSDYFKGRFHFSLEKII